MASVMKTLLLNPPSFEKLRRRSQLALARNSRDRVLLVSGVAQLSRGNAAGQPAAGCAAAQSHAAETFASPRTTNSWSCSLPPWASKATCKMARAMKEAKPDLKIAFVGPHVQIKPAESLCARARILISWCAASSITRWWNLPRASRSAKSQTRAIVKDGEIVHNPTRPPLETAELDELPFATEVY